MLGTIVVAIKRKSNFDHPLSPLHDLLELHNLYQSIALELLRKTRRPTILIGLSLTVCHHHHHIRLLEVVIRNQ